MTAHMKGYCFLFLLSLSVTACSKPAPIAKKAVVPRPTVRIYLFGDYPAKDARALASNLAYYYPRVVIVGKRLQLPAPHYYERTKKYRYLSDELLQRLSRACPPPDCAIGLTTRDIIMLKPGHIDWGVMGYGWVGSRVGVATNRLFRSHVLLQMTRLSMHELGHAFGLPHCHYSSTCLMQDMNGKNKLPHLSHFCPRCAKWLKSKGWRRLEN
jgi:archaemetzincin